MESIRQVLCRERTLENPLHLTSIKANVGHAEAASGAASLAKVIAMFRHGAIPRQISISGTPGARTTGLNTRIAEALAKDHVKIDTETVRWERKAVAGVQKRRVAMINNFGASGNNVAIVVEEPPTRSVGLRTESIDQILVAFSAETQEALMKLRDNYVAHITAMLESSEEESVDADANAAVIGAFLDFAYTISARRQVRPWRISVVADLSTSSTLARVLDLIRDALPLYVPEPSSDTDQPGKRGRVIFIFPGQGNLQMGMGKSMYETSALFRDVVDGCHEKLRRWGYPGVLEIINPASELPSRTDPSSDMEIVAMHCALFSLQCALLRVMASWGVRPDAVAGHR